MLIDQPEQVLFDFVNHYSESMEMLDNDILYASGWGHYPLDETNADFLLGLLHHQQIRVYSQKYSLVGDVSADAHRKAVKLARLVGKRKTSSVLHALRIYQRYEPQKIKNEYNALYYPDLKAYVRFGTLRPSKLLDMLNQDSCNGVILFRDCVDSSQEDRFFIFTLGIQQSEYRTLIENAKEKQFEVLAKAIEMADLHSESIIPKYPLNE